MAILRKIIISLLPILITGCYRDFDPRIDTKPVLCLNSLITAGQPIDVKVTHTWVYTDEAGREDHSVKDADVSIYVNDELKEDGYIPKEGDHIRIYACSPTYGAAEAEVRVPHATKVAGLGHSLLMRDKSISFSEENGLDAHLSFDISVTMDIPNDTKTDKYYMLSYNPFKPDDSSLVEFFDGNFVYKDPVLSEHIAEIDDMLGYAPYGDIFFTDRQFSGDIYGLRFAFEYCGFYLSGWNFDTEMLECGFHLTLHSISESYYNWLNYSWQSDSGMLGEFGEYGLSEQMWGYSNVSTGAGVVAAQAFDTVTLNLSDYLYDVLLGKN